MNPEQKPAPDRFMVGDIVRYDNGVSALFRYTSAHGHRLYGDHVLSGIHSAHDRTFFTLKPASEEDIAFCRVNKPEWFEGNTVPKGDKVHHDVYNMAFASLRAGIPGGSELIHQVVATAIAIKVSHYLKTQHKD